MTEPYLLRIEDVPSVDVPTEAETPLYKQASMLAPTTPPWKVDVHDNVGENWLVADVGFGGETEKRTGGRYIVTTDNVHASEVDGDALTDAEWMVWCRNHWTDILNGLRLLEVDKWQSKLDEWNEAASSR